MNLDNNRKDIVNKLTLAFDEGQSTLSEILEATASYYEVDEKKVIENFLKIVDGENDAEIIVMSKKELFRLLEIAKYEGIKENKTRTVIRDTLRECNGYIKRIL